MRGLVGVGLLLVVFAGCSGGGHDTSSTADAKAPYTLDCTISNWREPCLALASPNDSDSKAEVDVAVNPTDPHNVVVASKDRDRLASNCVWAIPEQSKDGGHTWATTYMGGKLADRMPGSLFYGWQCITDPIMTFNKDGDLYYALQTYKFNPAGLPYVSDPVLGVRVPPEFGEQLLAVSHDGGETFPDVFVMHAGDETAVFHDYMRMGTNPKTGTVFTIWNQLTGAPVNSPVPIPSIPVPVGYTSIPVVVGFQPGSSSARSPWYFEAPDQPYGLGESSIVGLNDGTVIAWLGGFNSPGIAYIASSTDDGMTFTQPARAFDFKPIGPLANESFRTGTSVELAVDNSGGERDGCLLAVWGGAETDAVGPSDIYTRTSCDKGATWTDPVLVNKEHRGDAQWMPRATIDKHGTMHVVYFTRAYDANATLVDAEWAYSLDGGQTWTTQRLTETSFNGDLGIHQDGFPFIGDYIGISTSGGDVYMGFPSTVTGRAEIAVAHVVAHPENFAPGHVHPTA